MKHFKEISDGPLENLSKMFWGKEKELKKDVFKLVPVNFIDYDNEVQAESNGNESDSNEDAPEATESQKTFTFMDLKEDAADIGLPLEMTRLLVREEYKLLTDAIDASRRSGKGGMMITGQSGIGKSLFLIYFLVVRVLQKKPTFYQMRPNEMYLFCENGVYLIPIHMGPIRPSEFVDDCAELGITLDSVNGPIFLMDSNTSLDKPPPLLCERYLPVFVVQAGSPAAGRGGWMRGKGAVKYVMNPWTWSEIVAGRTLQGIPVMEVSFLREVFETLGPSACGCYGIPNRADLTARVDEIKSACRGLPFETMSNLVNKKERTDASQKILFMWSKDGLREVPVYKLASVGIARIYCEIWHIGLDEESNGGFLQPFSKL